MSLSLPPVALLSLAAALVLFGSGLWVLAVLGRRQERRVRERLYKTGAGGGEAGRMNWLGRLGRRAGADPELEGLLAQAGFRGSRSRELFQGLRLVLFLAALAVYATLRSSLGSMDLSLYTGAFVAAALAYLIPKWVLVRLAGNRRRRLEEEVQMLASLVRLLLQSGLGVNQALSVVESESRNLLPESALELQRCLRQVTMGAELADTLGRTGRELKVDDLQDLFKLLVQVDRFGGAVEGPFGRFLEGLKQSRRMRLQERVNLLSGKMTVVMVLFEFPALLAFLGAPGFMAIVEGLQHVAG